jgi:two-component system, cell cycle sensor histidine kinase and response regulator CckA
MQFEPRSDRITVLIADDDTQIRNLAQAILARDGYFTLTARDGQQALEASRDHPGCIHLLLSDVEMPRLTGPELCEQIRQERHEIICVLMSGNVSPASMAEEMPFIEKPFTPDALRCKLRELLQRRVRKDGAERRKRPTHIERSRTSEQHERSV